MTNDIADILGEYRAEYARTTGKPEPTVSYYRGWFTMPNGDRCRRAEFEKALAALESRPSVTDRQELVNGVMTLVKASQHVVKSLMSPHKDVIEERDTPYGCSVKDEAYWSN